MRAILTNSGSAGDIWPFLALAVEMQRHGHEPILALAPNFASMAERWNVPFVALGPKIEFEELRDLAAAVLTATTSARQTRPLLARALQALPQIFRDLRDLCRDADVLICGTVQPCGRMVHEVLGIPFVSVHTVSFAVWGTAQMRQAVAPMINFYRQREGLPPLRDPIVADAHSPQMALHAISRYVLRRPPNWPAHYHVTGYFFLDEEEWEPDPELTEFMASGDPPVVIGFGSAMHHDPAALTELVLDAIQRVGCRAIIQQGWSGLGQRQIPSNVHLAGFVPHSWLFPRAACVVHHGATGTTGATLRAGVPAVFVPHAYEHPLNGEVARELGIAGPPLPYLQLSAERLAAAIADSLANPRYRETAAALSQKVQAEQGVQTARQLIEQLIETDATRQASPALAEQQGGIV
jgi:sterol 3beta-glucosyltransferase